MNGDIPHDMTDFSGWPADYFISRDRFIEQARACGARMDSYPVKAVGPNGETLTVDVAAFTSTHDEHLIVLTSGVHGIEGFIGACIQIQALQSLARSGIPDRTGIVMIHAVNPWGFAHLRRVDENNADVNRNFINSSASTPVSHPQYAALDPVINPRRAPDIGGEIKYWMRAGKLIVRNRGIKKLFKPIAEGQYDFAQGLFFGGEVVGESCELLQNVVRSFSVNMDRIILLDIHSGLGPSATATLIGNSNMIAQEKQMSWLRTHYHQPVLIDTAGVNTYTAKGTFSQWCRETLSDKQFLYLCVEIGTVNPITLFSALRRENQAHHWAHSNSTSYTQTKQVLRQAFAPLSLRWRSKAVAQGLQVFERTFNLSTDVGGSDN